MHYFVSEGAPRIILAIFERDDFLLEGLQDVVQKEGIETATIVSAIGSPQRANIHTFARFGFPPEEKYQTFEGPLEMGSLEGSVIGSDIHAHVTLSHCDTMASMLGHLDPRSQLAYMAEVALVDTR